MVQGLRTTPFAGVWGHLTQVPHSLEKQNLIVYVLYVLVYSVHQQCWRSTHKYRALVSVVYRL